ncbi:AMP-binding protein [Aureimonas sp. ME7]|uniref:class I adenylate-forming enzyme family protein n=1 Tax=Aureimonas sp. ME7 TaxID=2744252 RepID=UPI0015FB0DF9|nr:AMP-binding protein [Aureimonas sp. ME7]
MTIAHDGFVQLLRLRAETAPDRIFARFEGRPLTIGELDRASSAFAAHLREMGIGPGARVAVMMRNSIAAIQVIFGLAKAGVVWVPVNAQQRGEGLHYLLEHSRPCLLVHDATFASVLGELETIDAPRLLHEENRDDGPLSTVLASGRPFEEVPPASSAPLAIMYTSGTTGRPKGVIVTHRMLHLASQGAALVADVRAGDVFFVWEPFFHVGGAQLLPLPLSHDVTLGIVERFSASRFWDEVRREGATHIHYLGGILQILLKQPPSPGDRSHDVRIAWGGGCPAGTGRAFQERFGTQMRECYGMTEASSITTFEREGVLGSVGRAVPWLQVEVLDDTGSPVPFGQRGEIVVAGLGEGAIFPGYYENPEATANALKGGRLHTGDVGSTDEEGRLLFHGRMTDSVRCRGENVSAFEVEYVVAGHPDVEDCAMIGVAAEIGEQDIKLFVQPKADRHVEPALLSNWLQQRLASYQLPRYVTIVDGFERTASQRIMKHKLATHTHDSWDRLAPKERSA